jgi:hypothetical protein
MTNIPIILMPVIALGGVLVTSGIVWLIATKNRTKAPVLPLDATETAKRAEYIVQLHLQQEDLWNLLLKKKPIGADHSIVDKDDHFIIDKAKT